MVPVSTSVSKFTSNITVPVSTVTYTSVFTSVETITTTSESTSPMTFVSTMTDTSQTTYYSSFTSNGTEASAPASTGTLTHTSVFTLTSSVTSAVLGTSTRTTVGTVTGTSTITGVVIPSVGEVTITYYRTIDQPDQMPVTKPADPVKVTGVEVIDGTTVNIVQSQGPVVVVVAASNEVKTEVVAGRVSTGVTWVEDSVVTNVVVITPTPEVPAQVVTTVGGTLVTVVDNPNPVTVVRLVDGVQRTIVETPPPQTIVAVEGGVATTVMAGQALTETLVNNVGGTPVTRVIVTTPTGPPFQPVSYTVVRDAGGSLVTEVMVTTPTAAGEPLTLTAVDIVGGTPVTQLVVTTPNGVVVRPVSYTITTQVGGTPTVITMTPAPTTTVETIDGTPITRTITPPVTSFTTTMGGTLITTVIVTTPTGTEPVTLSFASTVSGSLRTFTTTFPPTTRLTTLSGKLRTLTSTPPPSTFVSTRPRTTRTFTSTSMPTSPSTATERPERPTVVSSTRTYRWTEADIFVGTFLPPLLGVTLAILVRVIDHNAKLYQPFQTLASVSTSSPSSTSGGGTGEETLLLPHTGLPGLVAPFVALAHHGRNALVPALSTAAVGCASLAAPLAAEAVGLKLHGECWANTASPGCGPALGVSPAPARALAALLAAVAILLVAVGVLLGMRATGLWANPWSIAGMASLVRNKEVRMTQSGEAAMKRVVKHKRYGLGYFTGERGREEYGIVLLDEEAGSLRRHAQGRGAGGSESDLDEDPAAVAKWDTQSRPLPFVTLRYPWRIAFALFQLGVLIFIAYYHAYYRGEIRDNGKLWLFLNSNTVGVRFVSAIIGVIIALCWQSFFLSKYYLLFLNDSPTHGLSCP